MNRFSIIPTLLCFASVSLIGPSVMAQDVQQPVGETTKAAGHKAKPVTTRPASGKATAPPQKTATNATAKKANKPGKRFWSRIMGAFRDVHSAEKKPK